MKVYLTVTISLFFIFNLFSKEIEKPVNQDIISESELPYCSESYLDLEHKIEQAQQFLIEDKSDLAIEIYDSFDLAFETIKIPAREKISLANKVAKGYRSLSEFRKGEALAKKNLNVALLSLKHDDYELAKAHEILGAIQIRRRDFDSAIENLTSAQHILDSYTHEFSVYYFIALYHLTIEEIHNSVNAFEMAVERANLEDISYENLELLIEMYLKYVEASVVQGDFGRALQSIEMAGRLSKQRDEPLFTFYVDFTYAVFYLNRGEPKKAMEYLNKEFYYHNSTEDKIVPYYYYNAMAYMNLGQYDKSLVNFDKAIAKQLSIGGGSNIIGQLYKWKGLLYNKRNDPERALEALEHALCSFLDSENSYHRIIAGIHSFKGRVYLKHNQFDEAKECFLEALKLQKGIVGKIETNINLAHVHLGYFESCNSVNYIDSILYSMDVNDQLLKEMRIEHRYFAEQGAVESQANQLYSANLHFLEKLNSTNNGDIDFIDRLFKYVEGMKTYLFKRELKEQKGLHTYGVSSELIQQLDTVKLEIKKLQDEIFKLESEHQKLESNKSELDILAERKTQASGLIDEYNSLLLKVETDYPNYFNYKYNNSTISIQEIQNSLNPDEALIEYFISQNSIYVISIEQDTLHYFSKEKPSNWEELLENYSNSVSNIEYQHQDSIDVSYSKFTESSFELYNIILKDITESLGKDVHYLRIIPDEEINFIQFDNLLTAPAKANEGYKELAYLVNDYTTSRSASAFMYSTYKKKPRRFNKYNYIGFAPKYTNKNIVIIDSLEADRLQRSQYYNDLVTRGSLKDLPSARKSVNLIASIFEGLSFVGKEATKEAFLNASSEGTVLHFAGHAVVNTEKPEYSQLLFSHIDIDSQLYASDIYDMGLNIDLAVLSACNTGNGKRRFGEGVMSLSRAFKYAGCSSLVMSLWNIPDVQTADLDYLFFEKIKKGSRIDDALRESKLNFLEKSTQQTAHPFYWSGLTASGKMTPISKPNLWDRIRNAINI